MVSTVRRPTAVGHDPFAIAPLLREYQHQVLERRPMQLELHGVGVRVDLDRRLQFLDQFLSVFSAQTETVLDVFPRDDRLGVGAVELCFEGIPKLRDVAVLALLDVDVDLDDLIVGVHLLVAGQDHLRPLL